MAQGSTVSQDATKSTAKTAAHALKKHRQSS